jgi:hypothetical protein
MNMLHGHEGLLLAAMMNGRDDLQIEERDFSFEQNRLIFNVQRSLKIRTWRALQIKLERLGQLQKAGGISRLTEMQLLPTDEANVEYALGEVLEASRERRSREIGKKLHRAEISREQAIESLSLLQDSLGNRGGDEELVDYFPEPLNEVAFHGLAGDIVRRISQHTEASEAALLVQVLVTFGNVIGRNAYAVADAARHYMNLFMVLVGETSKSRKGTSWAHISRIFRRADEVWTKNCIANGLSSGEGVIWNVRDAITKDDEVIDAGVSDKRLCVVEGEFAQVFKVMSREGNTLSPVIRSAWDSGNLRSMTKNSPARATGAHVSIIGHITRDEQRRLLTATEAANGFANRFGFVAVRRSKVLPEGGYIEEENLNALVKRLHEAIEFARTASKITRSAQARELWNACYEQLSEGKRGLLGAITARAEAIVFRLSCIYALLDCSTRIDVEHHRAALALWNYCETSARWIFGMVTGDPRADRILTALRATDRNGMTQTQISCDVFKRNITSAELNDALRILDESGLAKSVVKRSGGRGAPLTKWIVTA